MMNANTFANFCNHIADRIERQSFGVETNYEKLDLSETPSGYAVEWWSNRGPAFFGAEGIDDPAEAAPEFVREVARIGEDSVNYRAEFGDIESLCRFLDSGWVWKRGWFE